MPTAGNIKLILPEDYVLGSAVLRVELVDDDGRSAGFVDIDADAVGGDVEQCRLIQTFAFNVDEAKRKAEYLERHPDNLQLVAWHWREDLHEWMRRQRDGRGPYEGLDDAASREWRSHR